MQTELHGIRSQSDGSEIAKMADLDQPAQADASSNETKFLRTGNERTRTSTSEGRGATGSEKRN